MLPKAIEATGFSELRKADFGPFQISEQMQFATARAVTRTNAPCAALMVRLAC